MAPFSSFSGSDGVLLRFHPANTDLPPFVYHGGVNAKGDITAPGYVLYVWRDGNFQPID